jgi:hypothetical protein
MKIRFETDSKGVGRLVFGTLFAWDRFPDPTLGAWLHGRSCSRVLAREFLKRLKAIQEGPERLALLYRFVLSKWESALPESIRLNPEDRLVLPACTSGEGRETFHSRFLSVGSSPEGGHPERKD